MTNKELDTQSKEIIGRNILINELVKAEIEFAIPGRDKGIDLLIYKHEKEQSKDKKKLFKVIPVQLKAASKRSFSLHKKYADTTSLRMVYICNFDSDESIEIYVMTYKQALSILASTKNGKADYTKSNSWNKGYYAINNLRKKEVYRLMQKFKIKSKEDWNLLI